MGGGRGEVMKRLRCLKMGMVDGSRIPYLLSSCIRLC